MVSAAADVAELLHTHDLLQVLLVRVNRVDVFFEILAEIACEHRAHRLNHAFRIGRIVALHGTRVCAEWRVYHRVDGEVRDRGPDRIAPQFVGRNDLFRRDDHPPRSERAFLMRDAGTEDPCVAVLVGLVDVDNRHVRIERRRQQDRLFGVRIFDDLAARVFKPICAAKSCAPAGKGAPSLPPSASAS